MRQQLQNELFVFSLRSLITLHTVQKDRKPVSLSGRAFTFNHVLISSDLSTRFILPLQRSPDAEKILSTYAWRTQVLPAAQQVLSYGCSLSHTAHFCRQTLNVVRPIPSKIRVPCGQGVVFLQILFCTKTSISWLIFTVLSHQRNNYFHPLYLLQ